MNSITLTGNLTKDLEIRYIPESETAVISNTLAVKRPHTKDKTDFIPINIYGKTAERCEQYLHKGSKILIQGSLVIDPYEKNGEKKSFTKVNCDIVEFLDGKDKADKPSGEYQEEQKQPEIPEGFQALEDDEPF